jgi:uncharacterized repeat protein (TIGR03987 family)
MTLYAVISITLALIFYTIGVWSEKIQRYLKTWHVILFWTGLCFDTLGTTLMSRIAKDGFTLNAHGITGLAAIVLMALHVIWATVVLAKDNQKIKEKFHKFSILVWCIWLVPYISGAVAGMLQ